MAYQHYDSSGTDDGLPTFHQNRMPRGGHVLANARSALPGSVPYSGQLRESDIDTQVHKLEREAYGSVLRAFKAQADAINWDKESLMTELRKELRVSDEEHRELLTKVNADDSIQKLREYRKFINTSGMPSSTQPGVSSPTVSASRKKFKVNQLPATYSFASPSAPFHPHVTVPSSQPSSSGAKREFEMETKNTPHKTEHVPPGAQTMKSMPYSTPCISTRGQFPNQTDPRASNAADSVTRNPLIGRTVRTRWHEDNNFYEAYISDYDPDKGCHALVYGSGTKKEIWEWVNLSEISPNDIQWEVEDHGTSRQGREACNLSGQGLNRSARSDNAPGRLSEGRGGGNPKGHVEKGLPPSCHAGTGKKVSREIKILRTDTLVKEVEKMLSSGHPSPLDVEKAKNALRNHEKALIDAIATINGITNGESRVPVPSALVVGNGKNR